MAKRWRGQLRGAKATIVVALRIVRDLQVDYDIPTSHVLYLLTKMYEEVAYYESSRYVAIASRRMKKEEAKGGS